jgi:hypothetical protein
MSETSIQAMESKELAAMLQVNTFGLDFAGILEKAGSDGFRFLVTPGAESVKQTATLGTILGNFGLQPNQINLANEVLGYVGLTSGTTSISLNQAFFYYTTVNGEKATIGNEIIDKEYAFSLMVDNIGEKTNSPLGITIKKVGVAVWNTKRTGIKDSLGLTSIIDYLKTVS